MCTASSSDYSVIPIHKEITGSAITSRLEKDPSQKG